MRFFCREHIADYSTYQFGYTNWLEREDNDDVSALYDMGYLPYSADRNETNLFYMARSARVRLTDFMPSSENRRILKKFDGAVSCKIIPVADFDIADPHLKTFCLDYFSRTHGAGVMAEWRLQHILTMGIVTHIAVYTDCDDNIAGYVFLYLDGNACHYWFSFYSAAMHNRSFGMYMMLDIALHAASRNCRYLYLGTAYGEGGRYKLNAPALEFWTGADWSRDAARLKSYLLTDRLVA